jgi:hypothetical protein
VIPFSLVIVPAFIIYRKSVEHVYENHPALYILAFGMAAAKVTNRLVVSRYIIIRDELAGEIMRYKECTCFLFLKVTCGVNRRVILNETQERR